MSASATFRPLLLAILAATSLSLTSCATSAVILTARAVEARSTVDIVEDNRIVVEANIAMATVGVIDASTEVYEQRLLVTGLFDDRRRFLQFRQAVLDIGGVRELLWHARYLSEAQQAAAGDALLSWNRALALDARVGVALISSLRVADVNFRVATDADGVVYLMGRARSALEKRAAFAEAGRGGGARGLGG